MPGRVMLGRERSAEAPDRLYSSEDRNMRCEPECFGGILEDRMLETDRQHGCSR